jgi:hypothetical protein
MRLPPRLRLSVFPNKTLDLVADFFGGKHSRADKTNKVRPSSRETLVHVFIFENGKGDHPNPGYVSSLVRSLMPETMVYGKVPISFFPDQNMPSAIGVGTTPDIEKISRYPFAWSKIRLTDPDLVEGLKVGKETFTFSWEEYEREDGRRGVLFAFYSLCQP